MLKGRSSVFEVSEAGVHLRVEFPLFGDEVIELRFNSIHPRFKRIDPRFKPIDPRLKLIDPRFELIDPRVESVGLGSEMIDLCAKLVVLSIHLFIHLIKPQEYPADKIVELSLSYILFHRSKFLVRLKSIVTAFPAPLPN